jgi:hypothetical protein
MLADDLELPEGALKSVDAIVTKSDGPHFLWATVHFVLSMKLGEAQEGNATGAKNGTSPSPRQVPGTRL